MTCKDCIHYCVCKDLWADENWTDEAPAEIKEMFSPQGCENFTEAVKWISMDEETKPKIMQECLCICRFDDTDSSENDYYLVLKWHDGPMQNNGYVNRPHFTDEGVAGMRVVYWRPLPTHPEKNV